ncbi:MAG: ATP-binding protein [Desulfomonilia bacterium]
MRKTLFIRIFAGYLLVILIMAILVLTVTYQVIRTEYINLTTTHLHTLGISVLQQILPLSKQNRGNVLEDTVRHLGKDLMVRITVINRNGQVEADSEMSPESLENHLHRPEVIRALNGGLGQSIRYSTSLDQDLLYVALPIEVHGKISGVLRLSLPLKDVYDLFKTVRMRIYELAILTGLLALFIAGLFSLFISSPIRALNTASRKVSGGDFTVRVPIQSSGEIRELTESFNEMAGKLATYFAELTAKNEELESILTSMGEALLVLDSEGRVSLANTRGEKIIGAEQILGRYYWELFRSMNLNRLIDEGSVAPVSADIELDDRSYRCSVTPLRFGGSRVVILHDITEIRQIDRIKDDLVMNVSHELRTPLTAIKGYTETLLDDADPKTREHLEIIKRHTDRLINIVNDLLTLSELKEQPHLEYTEIDSRSLIENLMKIYTTRIQGKGLSISVEGESVTFEGDAFKIEQLLSNLLDNAIKYTETGKITVSTQKKGTTISIKVKDTGIGIPRDHQGRIFERFYVVDKSRSRSLGGTGLGLSIAKHIALLHGGRIEVSSTPWMGSTFTVILPIRH